MQLVGEIIISSYYSLMENMLVDKCYVFSSSVFIEAQNTYFMSKSG
jgi:hypothetical protein